MIILTWLYDFQCCCCFFKKNWFWSASRLFHWMCNGNAVVVLCTLQIWLITLSDRTGISIYLFWITHQLVHYPKEIGVLDNMVLPLRWKRLHDDIPDTSLEPYWENVSVSDERGCNFDGASCSQGANMTDFRAETYSTKLLDFCEYF